MKIARRDTPRRVTPAAIDFYTERARQLRAEAYRNMWQALWTLLVRLKRLVL
ncbi:hypothetical protein J6524_27450 [Bradyrhizobium sp. WSM 1738]|uniref:RSP_7527 family protein n=1 Tax=Bradyrhizobium hereditatis TaxID=2821405 RepID=UPI001CE38EF9|nr:hypothetical protein [Bradyrhizobium hereditatis]MCA6118585.1 hypothetical protein [Bradyrhizobium hereditatis]